MNVVLDRPGPCSVCGAVDAVYRNHERRGFCANCADGNSTLPHPLAEPVVVVRAFLDRIDRARAGQLHGWIVDELPLYPTDATLPTLTVGIVRKLLAEIDRLNAEPPTPDDWRRLCVMLLLQHGRTINIDDVTLTQADDLDSYTVAWSRNPTSFSWQVRAFRDPESFDKAPDRPLGGPDVSPIVAARDRFLDRVTPVLRQRALEDNSLDAVLEQLFPGCTQPSGPRGKLLESLDGAVDTVGPNPYEED